MVVQWCLIYIIASVSLFSLPVVKLNLNRISFLPDILRNKFLPPFFLRDQPLWNDLNWWLVVLFFFLRECMTASSVCIISYILAWVLVSSMNLLSGRLSIWQAYNPAPPPAQEFGSLRVAWSRTGQWLNLVGEYLEKCYRFSFYSTVLETGDKGVLISWAMARKYQLCHLIPKLLILNTTRAIL